MDTTMQEISRVHDGVYGSCSLCALPFIFPSFSTEDVDLSADGDTDLYAARALFSGDPTR